MTKLDINQTMKHGKKRVGWGVARVGVEDLDMAEAVHVIPISYFLNHLQAKLKGAVSATIN